MPAHTATHRPTPVSYTHLLASGEKLKALQAAMDKIEKSFGKGSIMKMGDESVEQVEVCLLYTSYLWQFICQFGRIKIIFSVGNYHLLILSLIHI